MSKKHHTPLHIEWSPGRVYALETTTGRRVSGETIADLSSITSRYREVIVGISRNAVFLKTVPLPKAPSDDLRRILSVQIGQIFPLAASQLTFDFFQTGERKTDGYQTVVAAMRADDLRMLHGELKRANLNAIRIVPVALGAAAVAVRAGVDGAVIVEETPTGLALDIVQGNTVIYSRVTSSLANPLQEARRTMTAFGTGNERLVMAGGLAADGAITRPETSLGLLDEAIWPGFELAEERLRVAKQRLALQTRLASLLMLSAILLVGLVWVERSDAQAVITRGQGTWARELSKLRSIRDTETDRAQKAQDRRQAIQRAFEPGQPLSDIARMAGDALPAHSWLTGLILERGKPLQIRGTTTVPEDVARYMNNLSRSGRLRDVKLVFANSGKISETSIVQFSLTATAIGNLPLPEPVRTKGKSKTAGTTASASSTSGSATVPSSEQKDSVTP